MRLDINDSGQIIGTRTDSSGQFLPVLYDSRNSGPAFSNITLPSGFVSGSANAINVTGDVVGGCLRSDGSRSAFVNGVDLNTLIPPNSGWVLTDVVSDINDAGYIVGQGSLNGKLAVYILRPNVAPRGLGGVFGLILRVTLGVMEDGGGTVFINGHPVPVDPFGGLSAFQQDVLLGLATAVLFSQRNLGASVGSFLLKF